MKNRLIGEDPDIEKDLRQEEKGTTEMMLWFDDVTNSVDVSLSKLGVGDGREAWHAAVHGVTKSGT